LIASLRTVNPESIQDDLQPKTAGYWNLTGSKILIDDSDPNFDWSNTSATYDWCSGNGTWGNPYVIENVYIDGNFDILATPGKIHSENCISIRNSIKPFIIRNCTILNSGLEEYDSGIYIRNTRNGIVDNNTIKYCGEGVYVDWYSRNNTIMGNRFISDNVTVPVGVAIFASFQSHNTTIYDNYVFDYYESIHVDESDSAIVERNFLDNTYMNYAGIYVAYSNYGKVLRNTFAGSLARYLYNEFVVNQTGCTGTVIENNTIQIVPPQESGLHMSGAGGFTTVVSLESCDYTKVIDNLLILEGVLDADAPIITNAPNDFSVELGYTGESVSWTATDQNPNVYTIELQGSGIVTGPILWLSGNPITYNIPTGLAIGNYTYIVNFTDDYGHFITDTVTMSVQESPPTGDGTTIYGYDIAIILGVVSLSVLLLKKKRK
jgi:parallel beta-helix repeat protein